MYGYLRGGCGKSRVDQEQPEPRLFRRCGTAVGQRQCRPQPSQTPSARVPLDETSHVLNREWRGPHERVESRHRLTARQKPTEVVGGARRRGHWEPRDASELVGANQVVAGDDACRCISVAPYQLDGYVVVDPVGAVQCRRRESGEDAATVRPEPCPLRPLPKRGSCVLRQIHVRIDRSESRSELIRSQPALTHGCTADKYIVH